ncbi:hypothetical protein ABH931_002822, partial [Streptacidiphilus sp. MAP12-33]|uniref:hypothetical protein n=1 Tax=Streptacidiphilus sp. MAP12-33 TaxID=3156266 RepID=UPI00351742FE
MPVPPDVTRPEARAGGAPDSHAGSAASGATRPEAERGGTTRVPVPPDVTRPEARAGGAPDSH